MITLNDILNPKILGFTGPAGSGKDTCGNILKGRGWLEVKFAGPMYDALEVMGFGRPKTQAEKEKVIDWLGLSVTWRHAAQTLGTEWGRKMIDENLWLKIAERRIVNSTRNVVVTDVRFENEAAMIRKLGGKIVHLTGRRSGTGNDAHQSEAGIKMETGDIFIANDRDVKHLYDELDQFCW